MKITKRQLRRIIREAFGEVSKDFEEGRLDALDSKEYKPNASQEYLDGYEEGMQELEGRPIGGRGMR